MNIVLLEPGADPEQQTVKARGPIPYQDFIRKNFTGTPDQLTAAIEPLLEAGIDYIVTYFHSAAYDHSMLQRFAAEVMPRFR